MTRFMSALALALLLVASAMLQKSVAESAAAPIRLASEKAESGGSEGGGEGARKVATVPVQPIIFQLPGPGGLRRSIAVTLSLELAKERYRDQVVSERPKLKARIFEAWTARPLVSSGNEYFDPEEVKRRAQRASDNLFGSDIVSDILIKHITEVLIR